MASKSIKTKKVEKVSTASSGSSSGSSSGVSSSDSSSKSLESKLMRLLRLPNEQEAEKVFTLLKGHGLTRTQVVTLVETIRKEESEIIFAERVINGELQTNQEDLMDEADLAQSDIEQGMTMRMANRENFKVKRLYRALDKIKDGSYGECDGCGSDIGYSRLLARTIAELCIACKEEEERKENLSAVGRKPKSQGQTLSKNLSVG